MSQEISFDDLVSKFDALITKIDSADVRVPEDSALISLAADLVPGLTLLLREGIDLLQIVERYYDPGNLDDDGSEDSLESLLGIGQQISSEFAIRDLNDVAFFARNELSQCHDRLMETATQKRHGEMALASHCEASIRRLRKALVSVESTMFEFENQQAPRRRWYDVEVSLQIRKLYWNLRNETRGLDPNKPLEDRLRAVLYRIVAFRELSVYPLLRIDDRVNLRHLLSRILEWLNGDARSPAEGSRIWSDLEAFAGILVQVSHRQELRDHDLALITRTQQALFPYDGRKAVEIPSVLMAELEGLLGLDDTLDHLILAANRRQIESWRQPLARLQGSLSQRTEPAGAIDLLS